ncbi:MAG: ABC transporter ATP-binding protein [Dermatophilaceae bacterium]
MTTALHPALTVRALTKSYGKRSALADASFVVPEGTIHGLLGPNGSGKTTCLHLVVGLLHPDDGDVLIAGIPVRLKASRGVLGIAPDDLPLPGSLTGNEYLQFHDRMRGRDDLLVGQTMAKVFGLADDLERQIAQYSHGMKRKIQFVTALMHFPRLLVLDEPYRGLDPDAVITLRDLLSAYVTRGGAVLVATHDMLRAQLECDEVTILHRGRTVAQGPPDELRRRMSVPNLEQVFMIATDAEEQQRERSETIEQIMTEGLEKR